LALMEVGNLVMVVQVHLYQHQRRFKV